MERWKAKTSRRRFLSVALVAVGVTIVFLLFALTGTDGVVYDARTALRWRLESRRFKVAVLAQPDDPSGGWRHAEWDGWGWAGMNTVVYVVYNPGNLLAEAARTREPGVVFTPAPCPVYRVHRLEDSWYAVVFYTGTDWEHGDGTVR